jgi:epoxide hydrolase-like predicted phosphatase
MKNNKIKHLIFDIGGVIIKRRNINLEKIDKELNLKKGTVLKIVFQTLKEKRLSKEFNERKIFDKNFSKLLEWQDYEKIFERIYKEEKLNKKLVQWILSKKGDYKISTLTNNSVFFRRLAKEKFKIYNLFDFFFTSGEIGLLKPDPKIFKYVLKKIEESPEECLFIDNKTDNIKAANKLKFKTILFKDNKEFFQKVKKIGI